MSTRDKKPVKPAKPEPPKPAAEIPRAAPVEVVLPWAAACLARADGGKAVEVPKATGPMQATGRALGLSEGEIELALLTWAVERDFGLARKARALAGGFTVELARVALQGDVDGWLSHSGALTRFAVVVVDGDGATARLRLGRGFGARLDGRPPRSALGAGVYRLGATELAGAMPTPVDARLSPLVAEWMTHEDAPRIYAVGGCSRRESLQLALLLGQRLARGVTFVDGEALGRGAAETLAAARRDADLDSDVLVIGRAAELGEAWRAAASPPSQTAPKVPVLVVADSDAPRDLFLLPGLRPYTNTIGLASALAPTAATAGTATPGAAPKADDGLDHIRQMAVRDAERSMGIVRVAPPPRPSVPGTVTAPGLQPAPPPVAAPPPEPAAAAPAPNPGASPAPASPAMPTVAAPDAPKRKRSKKAMELLGIKDDDDAPRPPPAVAAPVAAAPAPAAAADPGSDSEALRQAMASESLPWMAVPENAPVQALAKIAMTSPNPLQRVEILTALQRVREPSVVAAMRHNANSTHPGLRYAAESGMQILFGPSWNTTRAVPKPVQQPPSDDKDRGPPGGW